MIRIDAARLEAFAAELFAGIIGGGAVAGQRDPGAWFSNGAFTFAIDPTAFTDRETAAEKVETLVAHVRTADSHPDIPVGDAARGEELLLPGEAEYLARRERDADGIPVPDRVVDSLVAAATDLSLDHPFTG